VKGRVSTHQNSPGLWSFASSSRAIVMWITAIAAKEDDFGFEGDPVLAHSHLTAFEGWCDLVSNCGRERLYGPIRHDRDALTRRTDAPHQSPQPELL
jgi:hypothetical protein